MGSWGCGAVGPVSCASPRASILRPQQLTRLTPAALRLHRSALRRTAFRAPRQEQGNPNSTGSSIALRTGAAGAPSEGRLDQHKGTGVLPRGRAFGRLCPSPGHTRRSQGGTKLQAFFSETPSPPAKILWLQPSDWWPLAVIDRPLPGVGGSRVTSRRNRLFLGSSPPSASVRPLE